VATETGTTVSWRDYFVNLVKAVFAIAPEKRTPWFLRPKRYCRRVRLAFFHGKTPDWASDAYKLIKYVNLLELIPTFGAFLTAPVHFFRRLPLIRRGKKRWYKTPLAFLALMVVAAYSAVELRHPHALLDLLRFFVQWMREHGHYGILTLRSGIEFLVRHQRPATYLFLLLICFLSPIWILPPCLFLAGITWLIEEFRDRRRERIFIRASDLNPYVMLIPLDPRVYWRLQWSAFAWGLFYFGLYALFVLVIFVDNIAQGPPHFFFRVGGLGVVLLFSYYVSLATLIQLLLIRPYAALLRATSSPPTRRMRKADAYPLLSILRQVRAHMPRKRKPRPDRPEVWKNLAVEELSKEWASYNRRIMQETSAILRQNPALIRKLRQDQQRVFAGAVPIEKLRDAIALLQRFETKPSKIESFASGMESIYAGNGIPSVGGEARPADLPPSPDQSH
jgi:hypothetical protein